MAEFMKNNSFSLLFVAIVTLLLVSQNANAQPGVSPFCTTATHKQLCNRMVNGASNLHDASVSAIRRAIHLAKRIQNLSPLIVQAASDLDPEIKKQLVDSCTESFSDTIDDLNLSIELLNQGDMGGVGTRLSAAFDSDCADALKERGVSVDALIRLNGHFANVMDNTLAVVFQF